MSLIDIVRPCPVCQSQRARRVLHHQVFTAGPLGEGYAVVVCENCGAGFADGVPTQAVLDRYYARLSKYAYEQAAGAESKFDFGRFEHIADQLEEVLPDKRARILDIGCATGGLVAVLRRRGYANAMGSDPSVTCAAAAARLHGVRVEVATLHQLKDFEEKFDAVLLVGVLEHLREVVEAVGIARSLLAAGGLLFTAQPDVEGFARAVNAPLQQFSTEHLNFFSAVSLRRTMASAGLVQRRRWHWLVEWREGVWDPVLSAAFVAGEPAPEARDAGTEAALVEYIRQGTTADAALRRRLEEIAQKGQPIYVWGAGTLTRRLSAEGAFASLAIKAFVDSAAPRLADHWSVGRLILPEEIEPGPVPILIASVAFGREIAEQIRNRLHLPNPIIYCDDKMEN